MSSKLFLFDADLLSRKLGAELRLLDLFEIDFVKILFFGRERLWLGGDAVALDAGLRGLVRQNRVQHDAQVTCQEAEQILKSVETQLWQCTVVT